MNSQTRIRVEGRVLEQARDRVYASGIAAVLVLVEQAAGGPPVLAERAFGSGPAARFAAANAARAMPRGAEVVVHGIFLKPARWERRQVIRLEGVDHIEHITHTRQTLALAN